MLTPLQRFTVNNDMFTPLQRFTVNNDILSPLQRFAVNSDTSTHSDNAVRQLVLAVRTHELRLWKLEATDGTWGEWLLLLRLVRLAHYHLNLLLVLEVDGIAVLWAHQHGRIAEGGVLEVGAMTLDDGGCQNGDDIWGWMR